MSTDSMPADVHTTIQILPPQLANQIAAGEVVERPASVVKELVENSLDAGATRISIDIEKGGRQLIRVRDNGAGVSQEQLTLALSRHATSKIATLDDLEAIQSLGFRGEALASISAVSRLILTSRPAEQSDAWSARAEGRDMAVTVQPAAHPVGTTLEVCDLFFNTPARRRFLRTDKTEFGHIDELIKRIALSRFDVGLTLSHNGKVIRQLPQCSSERAREKRVAQIASERFMQGALAVHSAHDGLTLSGWLGTELEPRSSDTQYSYVNGRMMRDKLLNHAIRQAYQEQLGVEQLPGYVLYLELDPYDVDVNVHPAKHEVRFHQARLVHDFVYQVLSQALSQAQSTQQEICEPQPTPRASGSAPDYPTAVPGSYTTPRPAASGHTPRASAGTSSAPSASSVGSYQPQSLSPGERRPLFPSRDNAPARSELDGYHKLLAAGAALEQPQPAAQFELPERADFTQQLGKPLSVVRERFLLLQQDTELSLLCLQRAWRLRITRHLMGSWQQPLANQPLLVPLSLPIEADWQDLWGQHQALLAPLGFGIEFEGKGARAQLVVRQVPSLLRQAPLQQLLPRLFAQLADWPDKPGEAEQRALCQLLASVVSAPERYNLSEAQELLGELAAVHGANLGQILAAATAPLAVDSALSKLMLDAD